MDATIAFLVVPEAVNVIWESYDDEPRAIVLAYDVPEAYPMPSYTAKVDALLRNRGMERLHEDPKMPNHYTAAQSGWVRVAHGYVWSDWWQMPRGELIRVLIACVTDGSIPQASNVGSVTISWYSGETAAEWMRKGATSRTAGNGSDAGRRRLPASQVGTNGTVR